MHFVLISGFILTSEIEETVYSSHNDKILFAISSIRIIKKINPVIQLDHNKFEKL